MLDVLGNFARTDAILRIPDALESVKLNLLPLHLSDNEGLRVWSRRYTRLAGFPSSAGQFHTQAFAPSSAPCAIAEQASSLKSR